MVARSWSVTEPTLTTVPTAAALPMVVAPLPRFAMRPYPLPVSWTTARSSMASVLSAESTMLLGVTPVGPRPVRVQGLLRAHPALRACDEEPVTCSPASLDDLEHPAMRMNAKRTTAT
jgi:hypothetical protein